MSDRGINVPGVPENFNPVIWESFDGLNTKPPRPAIGDKEMYWSDGFMPIGPSNLRVLWGTGNIVFSTQDDESVQWFGFGNIGDTSYGYVLQSDGTIHQFDTTTGARTLVLGGGAIQNPSSILGFSQRGSQYILFVKDQPNGYWLWDGTNTFTAGTISPIVTLTNSGLNYTSPPAIAFQTTGAGTGVVAHGVIQNGSVTQVIIDNPGSGFVTDDLVVMSFTGGGTDDQATATTHVSSAGGVSEIIVLNPGGGYTAAATVIFSGGGGTGATAYPVIQSGGIISVAIINQGTGYTSPPSISINDPGLGSGSSFIHGGSGFAGIVVINSGQITAVGVVTPGSNYTSNPTVVIVGDGTGAAAVAEVQGGQVTGFAMTSFGHGYTKALAILQGGNNAANATVNIFPFGISGTAIEVYQQRVWITNGAAASTTPPKNRTIFSAPSDPTDFADGGGAFQSTDSFLRVGYHWLRQTNGFLYLGGDSSVNYISGVTTSASGSTSVAAVATTTFGNQNVDPQLGSPWPSSVQVFSRNIVFANTIGAFVSYGGAVTKASLPLDGFYATGPIYGSGLNFSSAVAQIFGIPVYMLLLPVNDLFTGQTINKLLMWDGKRWFTSEQDRAMTFIASQEINSVLTAWGTDGKNIFPLFAQPSTGFTKVVQSKLYSTPAYYTTKTAKSLSGVINSYALDGQTVVISIDSEKGLGVGNAVQSVLPASGDIAWTNNTGGTITWTNNSGVVIEWGVAGLDVFGPLTVAQQGRMMGFTVQTNASDLALLSLFASEQTYTPNV